MRRGKRFLENDNTFIYVGTAIFIMLAIALGIIMYMTTKNGVRIENGSGQASKEQEILENTETVTSDIGKTVEEQQSTEQTNVANDKTTTNAVNTTATNNTEVKNTTTTTKTNSESKKDSKTTAAKVEQTIDESDTATTTNASKEKEVTETKKEITFVKPAEGEIICEYAKDNLIYSETLKEWITHTAIDIKADKTSVIKSAADGIIKSIVNDPRYGLTVVIEHDDGYETVYSNLLTAEFVVEGEEVTQGQTIGTAGNTAAFESNMECHLHFELLKDGEYLDPSIYLK